MKKLKKVAIISAVVLMISIVPAFALNDINTTNGTGDQTQTQTKNTSGTCDQSCQKNCDSQNCGTCNGDQHKYQYGKTNSGASGSCDGKQHKYQFGLKNNNAGAGNCGQQCSCTK